MADDDLQVVMADDLVGIIERTPRRGVRFRYDDDAWRARPDATPLSTSMPIRAGWYESPTLTPYLWGLLPDNELVIDRWARDVQVSARDVFGLLAHVGADVAGAAQYLRPGVPSEEGDPASFDPLDEGDIEQMLARVRADATAWHPVARAASAWSLGGAQAKLTLSYDADADRWSVPHGAAPTTHILKPAIEGLVDHDLNEHLCLAAAAAAGLPAAASTVQHFGRQRALVVRRYDRITSPTGVVRLHQEDFCQALGVLPVQKYQHDGGPTLVEMAKLLRAVATDVADREVELLLRYAAFNWLVLGTDAHAKNYSLVLAGSDVRLAPMYDVASAAPSSDWLPKEKLAHKVGGHYLASKVQARHWAALAEDCGLDGDGLVTAVRELAEAVPDALVTTAQAADLSRSERRAAVAMAGQIAAWTASCRGQLL